MLVKAQICVDFAAGSEKSSSTTGRTTMGHVLAQSVAVEGLENEKKKFSDRPRRPQNTCRMVTIDHGRGPSSSRKATFFVVTLDVQESLNCYRPKVRKVTPGRHILHHLVNLTFQHTFTHILGPLASFGGIPLFRGSFPPDQNGCLWAPGGLPP